MRQRGQDKVVQYNSETEGKFGLSRKIISEGTVLRPLALSTPFYGRRPDPLVQGASDLIRRNRTPNTTVDDGMMVR